MVAAVDTAVLWGALRSSEPVTGLVGVVLDWKASGCDQNEATRRLKVFLDEVMLRGSPDEDDAVRDVLDFVTGWCAPHARLYP